MTPLIASACPFANVPEASAGRLGQGLTREKMQNCTWLAPQLVAQVEFLEWTSADHLRHAQYIGLRYDKQAIDVVRET